MAKNMRANLTSLLPHPLRQIRKAAMPIRANNIVQTGPNTQAGGVSAGFASVAYHVGIDGVVNMAPIIPASSEIMMATINPTMFFFFMN